jgi:hypothetical protein
MIEQLSAVVVSQLTQVPPPTPQVEIDSGVQTPLAQQPPGHDSALHRQAPPVQTEPVPHDARVPQVHPPETASQPSLILGSQARQAWPPTPQVAATGTWQTPAAQHPRGQDCALQTHTPLTQTLPAPHATVAPHWHCPVAPQLSARVRSQVTHAAPPNPQVAVERAAQVEPEQHPEGQLVVLQSLHTPPAQIRPAQFWQALPALPQLVLLVPGKQVVPEQQPLGHDVRSQVQTPVTQRWPAAHGPPAPHWQAPVVEH